MFSLSPTSKDQDAMLLSSIEVASEAWESFQWRQTLEQLQGSLNSSREARELAQAARKDIVETTKQFKRAVKAVEQAKQGLSPSDNNAVSAIDNLSKECRVIVKAYQGEIDNLTRRCKNSEVAFSGLCQALMGMPNPSAVFSMVHEQLQKQQKDIDALQKQTQAAQATAKDDSGLSREEREELIQLREDVVQYEIEIKGLKDQSVTVRKLEAKIADMEENVANDMQEEREQMRRMREEVAQYEIEIKGLKDQSVTVRKLEAKIAEMEENAVYDMQDQLERARQELAETEGRRADEALEREAALERRVAALDLQLRAERAGREAAHTHLLDADEGAGEREAAWEAQRRILVDDADRLRMELHETTRERDDLSLKVAAMAGTGGGIGAKTPPPSGGMNMADFSLERTAYEAEYAELAHIVNSLREELKLKDDSFSNEKRAMQAKLTELQQGNVKMKKSISMLEAKLATAPSQSLLNSMKRELRILKRLDYNADDVDASEDPEMTGAGLPDNEDEKDLESVLVERLQRTETDLIKERNLRLEQANECERLKSETEAAIMAQQEAEKLVQSLEKDLERAIASPALQQTTTKLSNRMPALPSSDEQASTLSSILDPDSQPPPKVVLQVSKSASEKADDDHSVATIIMAQRDRLRARCEALEAERDSFKRELQVQVQASESLKVDNRKLYEKVRYLQNTSNQVGGAKKRGANDRDLDLEALEQRYEASVDPFRQFSRAERQRKLKEMPAIERVVFIIAQTVLGTKAMRTALFMYVTALHLLVFITTAHWSHADTCDHSDHEHLAHLPPVVLEAAKALKGG